MSYCLSGNRSQPFIGFDLTLHDTAVASSSQRVRHLLSEVQDSRHYAYGVAGGPASRNLTKFSSIFAGERRMSSPPRTIIPLP